MGISAVLIVKNEEKNIQACLETLRFTDESLVVDSGSSDRTKVLAQTMASRVVSRNFDDFASQKNFAVNLASQDWILSIDADERVSEALKQEIVSITNHAKALDAYAIYRFTNFFGRDFVASGLQKDAPIRLFRRGKAVFVNPVHEVVRVKGKTGKLKNRLYHRSFQTIHEHLTKLQLYTEVEAQKAVMPLKKGGFDLFFVRPFYRFFSIYVLKQGSRDGIEGFFYAVLSGYYEWVRWMKQWEISWQNKDGKIP